MGLFFSSDKEKKDRYNVQAYSSAQAFAKKWQYEFAAMLGCGEDEGFYEALAYWKKYHKK